MPGFQAGARISERYRVRAVLGRGGNGVVYDAVDEHTGERVAVKVVRRSRGGVDRFEREVQATLRLQSEHVCGVLDFGTLADGESFLVMPLLEGMTLRTLLQESAPLELPLSLAIADQVLLALTAAHDVGVLHRDLKPENVFVLGTRGEAFVKVLDFGLARLGDDGGASTKTGHAVGTASYMAPEQARGQKDQDGRVDVWAAGVLLYEMTTGGRPFEGASYAETLARILFDPFPPPRARRSELPVEVEDLILRAMHRDRELRFESARSMRDALRALPSVSLLPPGSTGDRPTRI